MGYASISGRAITNPDAPRAFGVCDRCGIWTNHHNLRWQFDYRGRNLANLRVLVCETCEDEPQPQLKPRVIPPDPMPILNARVEQFCADSVDDRTTSNPALPPVDFATSTNVILSGLQFIDGHQLQEGELVLVKSQTNPATNGIYKAGTGVWTLQGYDNDKQRYIPAQAIDTSWSGGVLYLQQLGIYLGAVYCARGANTGRLYQIDFVDTSGAVGSGAVNIIYPVQASTVNRYDLYTGIYMPGIDYVRVTQEGYVRTPQQTGAAPGSLNTVPGYSNLVPGACTIGQPDQVPYGCAIRSGLPSEMDVLPLSGPLWPTLQDQSIQRWLNTFGGGAIFVNNLGQEVSFYQTGFWPGPVPGALWSETRGSITLPNLPGDPPPALPPAHDLLVTQDLCNMAIWHNGVPFRLNSLQLYPNQAPLNAVAPYPWGWGV